MTEAAMRRNYSAGTEYYGSDMEGGNQCTWGTKNLWLGTHDSQWDNQREAERQNFTNRRRLSFAT